MSFKRTILVSFVMLAAMLVQGYVSNSKDVPPLRPLSQFPTRIGDWVGQVQFFDPQIYQVLGVDDSFLCTYRNKKRGNEIELYIGYYKSQREGDLIHSPKNCLPGAGWIIVDNSKYQLQGKTARGKNLSATKLVIKKGSESDLVLYWFQSRGRVIDSEYKQKVFLVLDSILKHRTDGSFIRLIAPVVSNERDTLKTMEEFVEKLVPVLDTFLPS